MGIYRVEIFHGISKQLDITLGVSLKLENTSNKS